MHRHTTVSAVDDLPLFRVRPEDASVERFLRLLAERGTLTRRDISEATGWNEREIRALAEAAGSKVVRGQHGFTLTETADLDTIKHAAEAFISQGNKMRSYGIDLKNIIHQRTG